MIQFTRRNLMMMSVAAMAAPLLGIRAADAAAPFLNTFSPGWARAKHGDFELTVVTDGPLSLPLPGMGNLEENFPNADPEEFVALLRGGYLPTDSMMIEQNVWVVNTGSQLVLIDTGTGVNRDFGVRIYGPQVGQVVSRLRDAGIQPEQIDIVAITHAHPDHCWGLVDDNGNLIFPNAKVAVSRIDFDYWTDESRAAQQEGLMRDIFRGTILQFNAVRDRVILLEDGDEVVPGITAIATPGHSPGHMVFAVTSQGRTTMVMGDIAHHHIVLLRRPDWHFLFDSDPEQAARTRIDAFGQWAREGHRIASVHFPFPGDGYLAEDGDGFVWIPQAMSL